MEEEATEEEAGTVEADTEGLVRVATAVAVAVWKPAASAAEGEKVGVADTEALHQADEAGMLASVK